MARVAVLRPAVRYTVLLEALKCVLCVISVLADTLHGCMGVVEVLADGLKQGIVPLYLLR